MVNDLYIYCIYGCLFRGIVSNNLIDEGYEDILNGF